MTVGEVPSASSGRASDNRLRIGTYNLLDGGENRLLDQLSLLAGLELDVLGVQEAKHWDRGDFERMLQAADRLGMQPLFTPSGSHGCHLVTFYRWPRVQCEQFTPDAGCGSFHHALARARLRIAGLKNPLTVVHTHLDPFSPEDRLSETGWLTEYAERGRLSVLIGDLNTVGADDEEPEGWGWLPVHLHSRHRLVLPDGSYGGTDRRAIRTLTEAGFVDPPAHLGLSVPRTAGYWDERELWDHRSDHVLLSPDLASCLWTYEVVDTTVTTKLSDHLPVVVTLDLDRL